MPLNIDLPDLGLPGANSNLPGVKDITGSTVTVTPSASFKLVLDIDLTSPSSPVYELDKMTEFVLGLLIDGPSSGMLSLGPLGVTFAGATLLLSKQSGDTTDPATYTVGLTSTTPLSTLSQDLANNTWLTASGPVTATIAGQVNVSLPMSEIGRWLHLIDRHAAAEHRQSRHVHQRSATQHRQCRNDISFQPPNLVTTFANTDLLGNDTGIIGSLDNYLGQLQSLLNGQLFGLDIPVVGKALASAGSFVMQLKSDIDAIGSASGFQQIYDALTNALSAFDPATPVVQIQYLTTGSSTWANFTSGESASSLPIPAGYRGRPDHIHARRHLDAGDLADVRSWPARPGSDGQQRRGDGQRRLEPDVHPGHRSRCRALYRYRLVEHRQHPDGRHRNGRRQRQPGSRRRDHRDSLASWP